ncbi:MAG: GlsB/YeaQ/YmgE family stress response membrane protein [Deltaproteobacteria bacterium]|nr:GlsB/YeaQ/YmgE family stress response membrane protein [Deltaproteobacteria bacterium]
MGFFAWIILGGIAGWIAANLLEQQQGCLTNIVVGILGGVVGGLLFNLAGGKGVTGFNLWSFGVAIVGAVLFLSVLKLIRGHRHEDDTHHGFRK